MDATKMKGKGAQLFAKRQRRMEKFVVEGTGKAETDGSEQNGHQLCVEGDLAVRNNQPVVEVEQEERGSYSPVSFTNMHSGGPNTYSETSPVPTQPHSVVTSNGSEILTSDSQEVGTRRRKTRPSDRRPWAEGEVLSTRYASADWSTDDEEEERRSRTINGPACALVSGSNQGQRHRFRSVKPPTGQRMKPQLQTFCRDYPPDQVQNCVADGLPQGRNNEECLQYPNHSKSWSSVKFEPKPALKAEKSAMGKLASNIQLCLHDKARFDNQLIFLQFVELFNHI